MSGKIIVIDGPDGSGKTTQFNLLVEKLKQEQLDFKQLKFPQYGQKACGAVEEYLNGKYGLATEVGPYRASILFAVDRYDASFAIKKYLKAGKIVLLDRYVTANMAHQGGSIQDEKERAKYFEWLKHLEYEIFAIPKPDINIFLHCPADIRSRLIAQRADKDYLNNKRQDILEADLAHMQTAESMYLQLAKILPHSHLINCAPDNQLLSQQQIHQQIWDIVSPQIK